MRTSTSISACLTALTISIAASAGTNVCPDNKHAWGENIGWINLDDTNNRPAAIVSDANADGTTDVNDISYVLFRLGNTGAPGFVDGDANGDGVVDVNDISYVLFRLGNPC